MAYLLNELILIEVIGISGQKPINLIQKQTSCPTVFFSMIVFFICLKYMLISTLFLVIYQFFLEHLTSFPR